MRNKYFYVFLLLLVFACKKKDNEKVVYSYQFYNNRNGLNGDVISLNDLGIYIFDGNQLTTYDFIGNRIGNTLGNYNYFNYYRSVAIYDSILVMAASDLGILKINNSYGFGNLKLNMKYNYYCKVNDIFYKDSFLYILNGRQSNMDQIPFYKSIKFPRHSLPRTLLRFVVKHDMIDGTESEDIAASSFAIMNDSLMFFADRFISRLNTKNIAIDNKMFTYSINPDKDITSSATSKNKLYVSNEKSIYFFEYINDDLSMKGELQ